MDAVKYVLIRSTFQPPPPFPWGTSMCMRLAISLCPSHDRCRSGSGRASTLGSTLPRPRVRRRAESVSARSSPTSSALEPKFIDIDSDDSGRREHQRFPAPSVSLSLSRITPRPNPQSRPEHKVSRVDLGHETWLLNSRLL